MSTVIAPQKVVITETTPTVNTATSTSILTTSGSFGSRKYLRIQNNTAANIMISLSGNTLTGIVPTSTNKGIVLAAGAFYESGITVPQGAITAYQTSGGAVNTIVVVEGI